MDINLVVLNSRVHFAPQLHPFFRYELHQHSCLRKDWLKLLEVHSFPGPALTAVWYKAPSLTACCLSPLPGLESWLGHVRKLPVTGLGSGFCQVLHFPPLFTTGLSRISHKWHKCDEKRALCILELEPPIHYSDCNIKLSLNCQWKKGFLVDVLVS